MCFELGLSISWCWTLHLPFEFGNSYFSVWKTFLYYFLNYVLPFIFFDLPFCNFYDIEIEISIILIANFTYPFSAIIISIFKISIEFFISAIKTLISNNSFLFSEFWGQKSHLYIFIEYFLSFFFFTFSFMVKAFLKCPRMLCCSFIFKNKVHLEALCAWLAPSGFTTGHNYRVFCLFCFLNCALPTARLCRCFLWGGLTAPKNNFLSSWIEQFKHSH